MLVAVEFTATAMRFDCPGIVAIEKYAPFGVFVAVFWETTIVIVRADYRHIEAARYVANHFVVFADL